MIYSDNENKLWWDRLSNVGKRELLDNIEEKAYSASLRDTVERVKGQWKDGFTIEPTDLAVIRKWEK